MAGCMAGCSRIVCRESVVWQDVVGLSAGSQ